MMDFGKFAIIFQGILKEPMEHKTWVSSGTESWQGNTYSRGNIITSDLFYTKTSGRGVTNFTVAGHSFTIKDDGPTLTLGSRVYDVSSSRKVFIIDKSGEVKVQQQQANKALHPTAYSFVRRSSSLRLRRRVSLVVLLLYATCKYLQRNSPVFPESSKGKDMSEIGITLTLICVFVGAYFGARQ